MKARYKDRKMQEFYETCRTLGADNFSEFYYSANGTMGPRKPRSGAGHRWAYWCGWRGQRSTWQLNSLAHAAWAAGQDNRKAASDRRLIAEFKQQLETQ